MVTEIQQGLPVKQDYRLHRVAGDIQQGYWLQRIASSGVLPVTEKSAVPIITGKEPASNPVLTTGSPVTEVSQLQRIDCDKLVGQEVFFSKIPLTNRLQSLPTECRFTQPSVTVGSQELEILVK